MSNYALHDLRNQMFGVQRSRASPPVKSRARCRASDERPGERSANGLARRVDDFGIFFLAELGDKTQIAAMTMAAQKKRPWEVPQGLGRPGRSLQPLAW